MSLALEKISVQAASAENDLSAARAEAAAVNTAYRGLIATFVKAAGRRDHLLLQWEQTLQHLQDKGAEESQCIQVIYLLKHFH